MFQNSNIRKLLPRLLLIYIALMAMSLEGCSIFQISGPSSEEQVEKLEKTMGKGGYTSARGFAINSSHDIWTHDRDELEVEITAPTAPGSYPLIIYLSSLGEDAKAGRLWRETWAKAGYAVFSLQPKMISQALSVLGQKQGDEFDEMDELDPSDDDQLEFSEQTSEGWFGEKRRRPSREARNSELRYIGHEYFATSNLKKRMEHLFWAYQQLKIRADSRQPLFASVDFSKVILAGYDLGAQTVSAAMGEHFETALPSSDALKPIAAILLSPSVSLAEGHVRERFQKLYSPMLVITGSDDNDPFAISSPLVRTAVWEHAPSGGKYLLLLKAGRHRLLAGSEMGGRFGQNRRGEFDGMSWEGMRGGAGRGSQMMGEAQPMDYFPLEGGRKDAELGYKHVAAIFSVSTAFLDSVVKKDAFARSWLDNNANQWLDKAGSLKVR